MKNKITDSFGKEVDLNDEQVKAIDSFSNFLNNASENKGKVTTIFKENPNLLDKIFSANGIKPTKEVEKPMINADQNIEKERKIFTLTDEEKEIFDEFVKERRKVRKFKK